MTPFLNLSDFELDRPIYRIISFERLVDFFNTGKLVLTHPTKWDDPFETHVIGTTFKVGNATTDRAHRRVTYGQCWTRKSVSDAMWRIYSPDKSAVRIRTTPRKLSVALQNSIAKLARSSSFVGKVSYLPQRELVARAQELAAAMINDRTDSAAAQSLLFKRNSFSHESEVRALVIDRHGRAKSGLLRLEIDPHKLVESVLIDSRASPSLVSVYTDYLQNTLKFKGRVRKSTLYDPPPALVVELSRKYQLII